MSFKSFLISKAFFKQLGIMVVIGIILLFAIIKGLDVYTHNGDVIMVPHLKSADADSLIALSSKIYKIAFGIINHFFTGYSDNSKFRVPLDTDYFPPLPVGK